MNNNYQYIIFIIFYFIRISESNLYSQEQQHKRFIYGMQGQAGYKSENYFQPFFSYSIGAIGMYQFTDSSKIKLGLGFLFRRPYFGDNRGIKCDQGPCPPYTSTTYYFEFPVFIQYEILKKQDLKFHPFITTGITPDILTFSNTKYYNADNNGELTIVSSVKKQSIFTGFGNTNYPLIRTHLALGFGLKKSIKNKMTVNIIIQSQFRISESSYFKYNGTALVLSLYH